MSTDVLITIDWFVHTCPDVICIQMLQNCSHPYLNVRRWNLHEKTKQHHSERQLSVTYYCEWWGWGEVTSAGWNHLTITTKLAFSSLPICEDSIFFPSLFNVIFSIFKVPLGCHKLIMWKQKNCNGMLNLC